MNNNWNWNARITDKFDLHEIFPLPCISVPTSGNQLGMILRFKTFYLKIYDHLTEDSYVVQGYRYHEQNPVFEKNIPEFRIREFASQFTLEDHLIRFQQPCGDPNCFLLGYSK